MRKAQNKKLNDELFYKPKDLKQRHDELITDKKKLDTVRRMSENPELRQQEARIMEEKFPGTTEVMKEVKEKYEFVAEGYRMIMPVEPGRDRSGRVCPASLAPEALKDILTG